MVNTYDFVMSLEYLTHLSSKKSLYKTSSDKHLSAGKLSSKFASSLLLLAFYDGLILFLVILDGVEAYSLYSTFLSKNSPCSVKVPRKLSLGTLEKTLKSATEVGAG